MKQVAVWQRPGRRERDRGSVTVEFALALPVLLLVLTLALGLISDVIAGMQCTGAARDAALAQARGDDGRAVGQARAPRGATVTVEVENGRATARINFHVEVLGLDLPDTNVTAVADMEPGPRS
jgi:Flp pilus assembly protein TadG